VSRQAALASQSKKRFTRHTSQKRTEGASVAILAWGAIIVLLVRGGIRPRHFMDRNDFRIARHPGEWLQSVLTSRLLARNTSGLPVIQHDQGLSACLIGVDKD
jgi:hypothetical protein